jgi:glutamate 5-kinase
MRDTEGMKRIVVKIGTNTLCDPDGRPDPAFLRETARQIHLLRSQGIAVIVISSGAIGCGMSALGLRERPQEIRKRQALAAVGQHRLMAAWQDAFDRHKTRVAQVLLTHHTFDRWNSYVNLRACLEAILDIGAVPILNENDTVSILEIDATFGDNDRLGAMVAAKMEADLYVILSDVTGLYDRPPHVKGAKRIARVPEVTDSVLAMADAKAGKNARGGMASKLAAARELTGAGVPVIIAYGREENVLSDVMDPASDRSIGTWFDVVGHRSGPRRWLAVARAEGRVEVDAGAVQALRDGFHLLPAGVRGVEGTFAVESVVDIVHDGAIVARAVSHLSSRDLERCKGMQSDAAKDVLGVDGPVNVTKKGRLVLLDE